MKTLVELLWEGAEPAPAVTNLQKRREELVLNEHDAKALKRAVTAARTRWPFLQDMPREELVEHRLQLAALQNNGYEWPLLWNSAVMVAYAALLPQLVEKFIHVASAMNRMKQPRLTGALWKSGESVSILEASALHNGHKVKAALALWPISMEKHVLRRWVEFLNGVSTCDQAMQATMRRYVAVAVDNSFVDETVKRMAHEAMQTGEADTLIERLVRYALLKNTLQEQEV